MIVNFRYFELHLKRNPYRILLKFSKNPVWYRSDYKKFCKMLGDDRTFLVKDSFPCLDDKGVEAGQTRMYYFMQDLYVAQKIFEKSPEKHVDIGSRIDGFVAHVASYRPIELFDIRELDMVIPNVIFKQADITNDNQLPIDYCDSISSLHAIEHFGLGRYGDKLDPNGHRKGFDNITKILKSKGIFYFSVPMGKQRIDFNAHRVFSLEYLLAWVKKDYDIISFAYISDKGILYRDVILSDDQIRNSCNCNFGCAIFELRKK